MARILPVGKVPRDVLERMLVQAPTEDPQLLMRPSIGLDCAVVEIGATLLVRDLNGFRLMFAQEIEALTLDDIRSHDQQMQVEL
jgi:hypothetical protein